MSSALNELPLATSLCILVYICMKIDKVAFNLQKNAKKVVVVGGGYIGMEVAAAAVGWNLDTTV